MHLLTLSDVSVTAGNLRCKLREQRRAITRKLCAASHQRLVDAVDKRRLSFFFQEPILVADDLLIVFLNKVVIRRELRP